MSTRDYYKIVQVDHEADAGVIEAAYRYLARQRHPDLNRSANADDEMAELNRAFNVLRDPAKRAAYDATRRAFGAAAAAGPVQAAPTVTPAPTPPVAPPPPAPAATTARWERARGAGRDTGAPTAAVLDFGRYTGWTLDQIARQDPAYLEWLRRHSSGMRFRQRIDELLSRTAPQPAAAAAGGRRR